MGKKHSIGYIKDTMLSFGIECLTDIYKNNKQKLSLRCQKCNYNWEACFNSLTAMRSGCPSCAGKSKHSIEDCVNLASKYNGICLSDTYINNWSNLQWQCENNHIWLASFNVVDQGHWCNACFFDRMSLKYSHSYEHVKLEVEKRGGTLLSDTYKSKEKIKIKCSDYHIFNVSYDNMAYGNTWCPECSTGKTQRKLLNLIQEILPKYKVLNNYKGFDWLKTQNGGKQELDIYIPDLKLAIEYDGEQHFQPIRFGGVSENQAKENLKNIKRRDRIKNNKIKKHPNDVKYFVRFNYLEKELLTYEYIKKKLIKFGIKIKEKRC